MTKIAVKNPIAAMNLTAALKNNVARNPIAAMNLTAALKNNVARNPIAAMKIAIILQIVMLLVDKIKVGILHAR